MQQPSPNSDEQQSASPTSDQSNRLIIGVIAGVAISSLVVLFGSIGRPTSVYLIVGSVGIGAAGSYLWAYLPQVVRTYSIKATTIILLGPLLLYNMLIPFVFLWQFFVFIGNLLVPLFHLGSQEQQLIQMFASGCMVVYAIHIIFDYFYGHTAKPNKNFYPVSLEQAEKDIGIGVSDDWRALKARMQPGDTIWAWRTPDWTWQMLIGRCGYTIVRNGKTTRHTITIGMN